VDKELIYRSLNLISLCDMQRKAAQHIPAKPHPEPEITWTHIPRLDPGEYPAYSRSAKIVWDGHYKRWYCAVQFDVLSEDLAEIRAELTWFLNMGDREKPHAGRRGNYWQAWTTANGGPPPRRDRLSPRVFTRRYARVGVADTTKNFKQTTVAENMVYSVVRQIVRWESGGGR
jgi:hypothetical protein